MWKTPLLLLHGYALSLLPWTQRFMNPLFLPSVAKGTGVATRLNRQKRMHWKGCWSPRLARITAPRLALHIPLLPAENPGVVSPCIPCQSGSKSASGSRGTYTPFGRLNRRSPALNWHGQAWALPRPPGSSCRLPILVSIVPGMISASSLQIPGLPYFVGPGLFP